MDMTNPSEASASLNVCNNYQESIDIDIELLWALDSYCTLQEKSYKEVEELTTKVDAWAEEWERLFKLTPKVEWKKKTLKQLPGEVIGHFHYRLIYSYLVSKALRELGQWMVPLTEEFLGLLLRAHVPDAYEHASKVSNAPVHLYFNYSTEAFIAQLDGMCRRAARFAISQFDPATYARKQEQGRRGGLVSKYGIKHYQETKGMSVTEAAKHLGCTRRTIYNLRKKFDNGSAQA